MPNIPSPFWPELKRRRMIFVITVVVLGFNANSELISKLVEALYLQVSDV